MRTPEFIQRCLDAGMPLDLALTAAKAFEAECEIAIEQLLDVRREKERARQAKHRAKKNGGNVVSRDKTLGDVTSVVERDLTRAPTHVEDLTSSSLRSEEDITPRTPSVSPPRKAKSTSKPARRCPETWVPTGKTRALLVGEGHEPGDLERALTRMRDHEFKTARSDWDATFRNWVREDRDRRKPNRPDHPATGRAARRGVWAEVLAEERGEDPGRFTGAG